MLLFRAPSTYTKCYLPILYVSNKSIHKCEIQLIVVFGGECTHLSNAKRERDNTKQVQQVKCGVGLHYCCWTRCLIRQYSLLGFSWRMCDALFKTRVLNTKNEVLGTWKMPSVEHDTSSKSPSWNNQFPWMQAHVRCLEILNKSVKKSSQWESWKSWTMNEFGKVKQRDENELMWKDEILIVTWTLKGVITFLLI